MADDSINVGPQSWYSYSCENDIYNARYLFIQRGGDILDPTPHNSINMLIVDLMA